MSFMWGRRRRHDTRCLASLNTSTLHCQAAACASAMWTCVIAIGVVGCSRQNFTSGAFGTNGHVRPQHGCVGRLGSLAQGQGKGRGGLAAEGSTPPAPKNSLGLRVLLLLLQRHSSAGNGTNGTRTRVVPGSLRLPHPPYALGPSNQQLSGGRRRDLAFHPNI